MKSRKNQLSRALVQAITFAAISSPALAEDWPIDAGNQFHSIYSSYGQYYEAGGGLHLHEGVDIPTAADTAVFARTAGTVLGVRKNSDSEDFMVVNVGGGTGWNFIHMTSGMRPAGNNGVNDLGGAWAAGDTIKVGDELGKVAAQPANSHPTHLHVDRGTGADPYFSAGGDPDNKLRTPMVDAVSLYTPSSATTNPKPVVSGDFFFRVASHDRNGTLTQPPSGSKDVGPRETERTDNQYFVNKLAGIKVVGKNAKTKSFDGTVANGSADIDIIASAVDSAGGDSNHRNGVQKLAIKIKGQKFGDKTGDTPTTVFDFSGEYLEAAGSHGYGPMRATDAGYVRAIYSNDATTNSKDIIDPDETNRGTYWYTPTNYSGDLRVQKTDRDRFWNSDARNFVNWNDPDATVAFENASSNFRDDIYKVDVVATDIGGKTGDNFDFVILDNWKQTVTTSKAIYNSGENVEVTGGEQYTRTDTVELYLLDLAPNEGFSFTGSKPIRLLNTDFLGVLDTANLGTNFGLGDHWLATDYNHDGLYISALDAFTKFTVIPEPHVMAFGLLAFAAIRRRR